MDHCKRHLSLCRSNLLETIPQTNDHTLQIKILPLWWVTLLFHLAWTTCLRHPPWIICKLYNMRKALDQINQALLMISLHWLHVKFNFWFSPSLSCITELLQPSVSSRISDQSWSSIPKTYITKGDKGFADFDLSALQSMICELSELVQRADEDYYFNCGSVLFSVVSFCGFTYCEAPHVLYIERRYIHKSFFIC